tara:strand:+ start:148 stop:324 length:177 start_codon:yes stop_codon:yes gene_type:complete
VREEKANQNKEKPEVKTFLVSLTSGEINKNIIINTANKSNTPSRSQCDVGYEICPKRK